MAAMGLTGADFAAALSSRKRFVDDADENTAGPVTGTGNGETNLDSSLGKVTQFTAKSMTGFCGLANQGATCYLNSLLQSLYMLPAFRDAVYSFEFDPTMHGEEGRNVARQLQRLFTRLEYSKQCAVSTAELTKSFGWTAGQQFQQQDVQECSAVIMDYLQTHCADTRLGNHMQLCHRGTTMRRLTCSGCGAVRPREEEFRDLQLDVKNVATGSAIDPASQDGIGSLERALAAYFATEKLEGVSCDSCSGKHDHELNLRIQKLPYFLPLVLKRFAMNWETGQRIKLSDWLSVPQTLDLTQFLDAQTLSPNELQNSHYELSSVLMHTGGAYGGHYFAYIRHGSRWLKFNDATVTELCEEELALAFADCNTDQKNSLCDTSSQKIPETELHSSSTATIGLQQNSELASTTTRSSAVENCAVDAPQHQSDAAGKIQAAIRRRQKQKRHGKMGIKSAPAAAEHAYMLIYTLTGSDPSAGAASTVFAPKALIAEIEEQNRQFEILRESWIEEQKWLSFVVEISNAQQQYEEKPLRIKRTCTLQDLTAAAVSLLVDNDSSSAELAVAVQNARLRVVHRKTKLALHPLTSNKEVPESVILESIWPPGSRSALPRLRLETKLSSESFSAWIPNSVPIRLAQIKVDTHSIGQLAPPDSVAIVAVPPPVTVGGLRQCAVSVLNSAARLVKVEIGDDKRVQAYQELEAADDWLTLVSQNIQLGDQVLMEANDGSPSALLRYLECTLNCVHLTVKAPQFFSSGEGQVVIEIDRRDSLLQLKRKIALRLGVCADEDADEEALAFKLRRADKLGGVGKEIKDLTEPVSALDVSKLAYVAVEKGKPLNAGQYSCWVKIVSDQPISEEGIPPPSSALKKPTDSSLSEFVAINDGLAPPAPPAPPPPPPVTNSKQSNHTESVFTNMGVPIVVSVTETVDALKERIAKKYPTYLKSATRLRIRCVNGTGDSSKLGAVLGDGLMLQDAIPKAKLCDGLQFAVQPTEHDEHFTANHILIRVQRWLPRHTQFDTKIVEIAVEKDVTTIADLKAILSKTVQDQAPCPVDAIWLIRPFGFQIKDVSAIPQLFADKPQPAAQGFVTAGAINAKAGDLIIFKDSREPEKVPISPHASSTADTAHKVPARKEAAGFKILAPGEESKQNTNKSSLQLQDKYVNASGDVDTTAVVTSNTRTKSL